MAKQQRAGIYKGVSSRWKTVVLDNSLDADLPEDADCPGLYVIFFHGRLQYIGQGRSVLKRLRSHIRMAPYSLGWFTRWGYKRRLLVKWRSEQRRFEALSAEARLIHRLRPHHNTLLKRGKNDAV